jgi:flavin-dependent dehydrogenase
MLLRAALRMIRLYGIIRRGANSMSYEQVVILGGGPVGLICAIEAKNYFHDVAIIEKRKGYTRLNVPILETASEDLGKSQKESLLGHLKKLNTEGKMPLSDAVGGPGGASFSQIEKALAEKAQALGVKLLRPYVVSSVQGCGEKKNGRYKCIVLRVQLWDDRAKKTMFGKASRPIWANLLVIATGGGAAADPVITKTLGFTYEKLKAKNYMAYGIFNDSGQEGMVPDDVEKAFSKIARQGAVCFRTADYQYLLSSLSGISKSDFALLKQSQETLKRLLVALKTGHTTSGVLESIKEVEKNVFAFKVNIQRARQLCSPEYPAVLVGDAAVTPHPDTGSGYATGFRGYQELKKLFEALSATSKADDNSVIFQSFNDRYELHVAEKALDGTVTICANNLGLLKSFRSKLKHFATEATHPVLIESLNKDSERAKELMTSLEEHKAFAEYFLDYLRHQDTKGWAPLDWDGSTGDLWKAMAVTWEEIKALTGETPLLEGQLAALEKLVAPKHTL